MPGDVHLDLLANKRIPDPFFRDNEAKLQWIDSASWEYEVNFEIPAAMLAMMRRPAVARAELGRAARERICSCFSMDRKADEWEALYLSVIG